MEPAEQIKHILDGIEDWAKDGCKESVNKISDKLSVTYQMRIRDGVDANGSPLAALKDSTLDGPVRRATNPTIRKTLGNTPLNASGRLSNSISSFRTSPTEWEIGAKDDRGDGILSSNAAKSHSGFPFSGDTPKAVRDPLQVSEKQMDFVENGLVSELNKVLAVI